MYWHQKAALLCNNNQRANTLLRNIQNAIAGMTLVQPATLELSSTQGTIRPNLIVIIEYVDQADADSIWQQVTTANTSGWIVSPSWASYASFDDDGTLNTLIERIDW